MLTLFSNSIFLSVNVYRIRERIELGLIYENFKGRKLTMTLNFIELEYQTTQIHRIKRELTALY